MAAAPRGLLITIRGNVSCVLLPTPFFLELTDRFEMSAEGVSEGCTAAGRVFRVRGIL